MSLRPGARWSPQTQGIAGGIGSAVAGVSDQIRRVMQDRPASTATTATAGGTVVTQSGEIPFGAAATVTWTIPSAAIPTGGAGMMTCWAFGSDLHSYTGEDFTASFVLDAFGGEIGVQSVYTTSRSLHFTYLATPGADLWFSRGTTETGQNARVAFGVFAW